LITCSLGNSFTKNYQNRLINVDAKASDASVVFGTRCKLGFMDAVTFYSDGPYGVMSVPFAVTHIVFGFMVSKMMAGAEIS